MTKKELEKLIKEYKPKYIYQRNNGIISKLEVVKDNILIDTKTGISINIKENILIGKVSSNIIDLIEVGDYVNGTRILNLTGDYIHTSEFDCCKERLQNKIKSVVTKEMMKSVEFRID